jgi:class I lanthipeptide synthase
MRSEDVALYRHQGVALLRAAAAPLPAEPGPWPDLADVRACRSWLDLRWSRPDAEAIGQASPALAGRVAAIRSDFGSRSKDVRRATLATARYLLRAAGRPTPFGLFAGVAPVTFDRAPMIRWGIGHRPVIRADTQWLATVTSHLEGIPELLERLDVILTNLAVQRGRWLEAPSGPDRVRLARADALDAVRRLAMSPIRFGTLADRLADVVGGEPAAARVMLADLVRLGVLLTCLRAPFTITDPLGHLIGQLHGVGGNDLPEVAAVLGELGGIREQIEHHNQYVLADVTAASARAAIICAMRQVSIAERSPLAVDLRLDCEMRLPGHVAAQAERAASALLLLSREPDGSPGWRAYHRAFADRYGLGTLVPVSEVVHPDAGLGYPPTYPGSVLPDPGEQPSERDQRLLTLAWQALCQGADEIVITDEMLRDLAGEVPGSGSVPPHVEMAARIHAPSTQALADGDYTLRVSPARAVGVMTSRFTLTATGSGLEDVYRALPVATEGALAAQMSFGAASPYVENIVRVPAYLPCVLSLGEHRAVDRDRNDGVTVIGPDDLAITATARRLHLVSISRREVVEPLVFHALELGKQPPPLARFLARLTRGFSHGWTAFDWGPCAETLPYLPQVRYGRTILSERRWRLAGGDLPVRATDRHWQDAIDTWRQRWRCPPAVELHDEGRALRLDLDQPLHTAILRSHLTRNAHAVLAEAPVEPDFGWIGGHAHEIVIPLVTTRPAAPAPLTGFLPVISNSDAGQMPGAPDTRWLYARLHSHAERHDEIIATHVPALASDMGDGQIWFVRYRSPEQTDHLRIRIRLPDPGRYGAYAAAVGGWAQRLCRDGLASQLVLDTYAPEVGRYGTGQAMDAAEAVFVADSNLVSAGLRYMRRDTCPVAMAAVNMVGIAASLLGINPAMQWLIARPDPDGPKIDRAVADPAIHTMIRVMAAGFAGDQVGWPDTVTAAWRARDAALAAYRRVLGDDADIGGVAESLLHMHYNRARGIDPDDEAACRRLARRAALAWRARRLGKSR